MKEEIPTPQEIMDFISASAKDAKYAWCKDSEGMADTPPMLMGQFPDGAGFMMPDLSEGHPTDHLPEMLSALLEAMEEKNGTAEYAWLAYVVEGYIKSSKDEMPEDWKRGDLAQEYKENAGSEVREGIICTFYPWEGECLALTIPFVVGDNGLPVFDKTLEDDGAGVGGGTIPTIFEGFRKFCGIRVSAKNN